MNLLSPGASFLLRPFAVLAGTLISASYFNIPILLPALGLPVVIVLRIIYAEFKIKRDAARLGARLAPRIPAVKWGSVDVMRNFVRITKSGYLGDYLSEQIHLLGSLFNLYILWENVIVTTSPKHIQIMLSTQFDNFEKGPVLSNTMKSVLGTGVFNVDGDMWKFHRSMTRPFFSRDRITHFELFDRHATTVLSHMSARFCDGIALDFQDLMMRFTADAATEFLFGTCAESLTYPLPYPHNIQDPNMVGSRSDSKLTQAILEAMHIIIDRQQLGWAWPLSEIMGDRTAGPMKHVRDFIEPIVEEALRKKKEGGGGSDDKIGEDDTMLDHLVKFTNDVTALTDETLNVFIAGRDTTGMCLTLVIYFLCVHPEVMVRLRAEVLEMVGTNKQPTLESIKEMKYLRAVIDETLRLYPPVPFNIRDCINGTTFPAEEPNEKPFYIPPKTSVLYSVFHMQRREDLWGPDAQLFDPMRFLDERLHKYLTPNASIFLPFNTGPRICLGQQFAYNEVSFMIIRILQRFESFELVEKAWSPDCAPPPEWKSSEGRKGFEKFWPKVHLTMYSKGGMWVKGKEADMDA